MSRLDARRQLVAYDIPDDRRRTRVARVLERYGDRVQYSVFVIDAAPARLVEMRARIEDLMSRDQDSILICDLGPLSSATQAATFGYLGQARPITDDDSFIV